MDTLNIVEEIRMIASLGTRNQTLFEPYISELAKLTRNGTYTRLCSYLYQVGGLRDEVTDGRRI